MSLADGVGGGADDLCEEERDDLSERRESSLKKSLSKSSLSVLREALSGSPVLAEFSDLAESSGSSASGLASYSFCSRQSFLRERPVISAIQMTVWT